MANNSTQGIGGFGNQSKQIRGDFGPGRSIDPTPATTSPIGDTAAPPPTGAEGFNITPAVAIAIGTAAAGLMQGIMAQRNAKKNREFQGGQAELNREEGRIAREEATKARQQANVQNAIGNIGNQAAVGAQQQGSALSGLASLFGGL